MTSGLPESFFLVATRKLFSIYYIIIMHNFYKEVYLLSVDLLGNLVLLILLDFF